MDPITNLQEQRDLAAQIERFPDSEDVNELAALGQRLAECFQALDEWRTKGGFDPYATGEPQEQEIILLTHRYDSPEAIGPFSLGGGQDHIDSGHIEITDGWEAEVVELENPNA